MPEPILNDDHWLLVISHLFGDFRSLARLMRVSRQLQPLVAQSLYHQLVHPDNKKRIDNLSKRNHARLASLLLTSCGILVRSDDKTHDWQFKARGRLAAKLPFFKSSLFFNYFDCLDRLPPYILRNYVWEVPLTSFRKSSWVGDKPSSESLSKLARVLTAIKITSIQGLEIWETVINELCQLSNLTIDFQIKRKKKLAIKYELIDKLKTNLTKFVTLHREKFPGLLVEILVLAPVEICVFASSLVEPTRLFLSSFKTVDHIHVSEWQFVQLSKNLKNLVIDDSELFGGSDRHASLIHLMYPDLSPIPREYKSYGKFLQRCRVLESLKVRHIKSSKGNELYDQDVPLLTWASQELKKARNDAATSDQISLTQLQSLVPVKEFVGSGLPGNVFLDAMDGFRYTLEILDLTFYWDSKLLATKWNWILPRLRVLKLKDVCFPTACLDLCPVLEELYLCDAGPKNYSEAKLWRFPASLKVLFLSGERTVGSLDPALIGELDQLEEFKMYYYTESVEILQSRMDRVDTSDWKLTKLKKLELEGAAPELWDRIMIQAAPNLEYLLLGNFYLMTSSIWLSENAHLTKLKTLVFTNWLEDSHTAALASVFGSQKHPIEQESITAIAPTPMALVDNTTATPISISTVTGTPTTRISQPMAFSRPSHISFRVEDAETEEGSKSMDDMLQILMQRPGKKCVDLRNRTPTQELMENELIRVSKQRVLRFVRPITFSGNDGLDNEGWSYPDREMVQNIDDDDINITAGDNVGSEDNIGHESSTPTAVAMIINDAAEINSENDGKDENDHGDSKEEGKQDESMEGDQSEESDDSDGEDIIVFRDKDFVDYDHDVEDDCEDVDGQSTKKDWDKCCLLYSPAGCFRLKK